MKRTIALAVLFLTASAALAAETTSRYTILLRAGASVRDVLPRMEANSERAAVRRIRTFRTLDAFAADLTSSEVAELRRSNVIESIQPVVPRSISSIEQDDVATHGSYKKQHVPWGIGAIKARDVWPVTKGSANVHVAILDTGIESGHADLVHAYAGGYNVFDPAKAPVDDNRHGTHVAGTIAAADNDFGVVGVAPNVKVWAVKVLDQYGDGSDETVAAGLDWVVNKQKEVGGRWVVNLSLGSFNFSEIEERAVINATNAGIVVVAASGNRGIPVLDFPAAYRDVIAVGAANETTGRADFSSFGPGLALTAPGTNIDSSLPTGLNEAADVEVGNTMYDGWGLTGSPKTTVTGEFIYVGMAKPEEIPFNVAGKVAVARRGDIQFREKARNIKQAGAKALLIIDDGTYDGRGWSLVVRRCNENGCTTDPEWVDYEFPLTIGLTKEDGEKLLQTVSVATPLRAEFRWEPYGKLDGTSMSTPHVTGAAALLLSLAPETNVAQIAFALKSFAKDVGEPGVDRENAHGFLDVLSAAKYVAPSAFGLTEPPQPPPPPKRRSGGH